MNNRENRVSSVGEVSGGPKYDGQAYGLGELNDGASGISLQKDSKNPNLLKLVNDGADIGAHEALRKAMEKSPKFHPDGMDRDGNAVFIYIGEDNKPRGAISELMRSSEVSKTLTEAEGRIRQEKLNKQNEVNERREERERKAAEDAKGIQEAQEKITNL